MNSTASGVLKVLKDEFNCLSQWSDADEKDCAELRFVTAEGEQLLRCVQTSVASQRG